MPILLLVVVIVLLSVILKIHNFNKTTYHKSTHNSYFGTIHDIGKNLVALMLKNYGFQVIDLGKDVPKETIVEEAERHHASVIALSALMTTTMQEMRNVIAYAREKGSKAKIIIGGAVITQDYADEIGADGYSADAAEAVRLTQRILGLEKGDRG